MTVLLHPNGIRRSDQSGDQTGGCTEDVSLSIGSGEMVAIIWAFGSGKSTLMNTFLAAWTNRSLVCTGWPGEMWRC